MDQSTVRGRGAQPVESWIDIASQPSSSSLSSAADEVPAHKVRRRRMLPSHLGLQEAGPGSARDSQEEYDESESESDRVMTSSGEGLQIGMRGDSDDDENRTAVNHPIGSVFTPQPNAFSHPPQMRSASQPVPGSYFPTVSSTRSRPSGAQRHRSEMQQQSHLPRNILSPSYNATAHHDEALRTSLSTLLSLGAAARGLKEPKQSNITTATQQPQRSRPEPMTLRLVPESALAASTASPTFNLQAPAFKPTLRRLSTTTTSASSGRDKTKRTGTSKERRAPAKKVRRSSSAEDVSPTLLTWVVSAGMVVVLSAALSFSAGYSLGKEAGRLEAGPLLNDGIVTDCAREASRSGLGLKRSLARSAVQT